MRSFKSLIHAAGLWCALFSLWLLLSGHYNVLLISIGVASCVAIVLIASRLDVVDHEAVPLQLKFGYLGYLTWLGREIAKSNIDVAKVVLSPRLPISPTLFWTPARQKTDMGRVIFANSITLTPGTVSVDVEGDMILVHAITKEAAEGLADGEMERRVTAIEAR